MPNDAKCGLVVGVGLVIAVAIIFFQRDHGPSDATVTAVETAKPGQAEDAAEKTPARSASGKTRTEPD